MIIMHHQVTDEADMRTPHLWKRQNPSGEGGVLEHSIKEQQAAGMALLKSCGRSKPVELLIMICHLIKTSVCCTRNALFPGAISRISPRFMIFSSA